MLLIVVVPSMPSPDTVIPTARPAVSWSCTVGWPLVVVPRRLTSSRPSCSVYLYSNCSGPVPLVAGVPLTVAMTVTGTDELSGLFFGVVTSWMAGLGLAVLGLTLK